MSTIGSIQSTSLGANAVAAGGEGRGATGLDTARVSSSVSRTDQYAATSLSTISQNTRPQAPLEFGTLALAALLFGQNDEESKNDPLKALIGLALLGQLQQQSQQTQFVQYESQYLQSSQSLTLNASTSTTSTAVDATGGAIGTQLDVSG